MLPGIDIRIANLIKAIEEVVLPAIPSQERLAKEQARLIASHLAMIAEQWHLALPFELGSLDNICALARDLSPHVDEAQSTTLRTALAEADSINRSKIADVEQAIKTVGAAVDSVILGDDGDSSLSDAARTIILRYGKAQSLRERVWFKSNGQDPDANELPDLNEIIDPSVA